MVRRDPLSGFRRRANRPAGLAFGALLLLVSAAASGQAINEFPVPTAGSQPNAIVAGPDDNLWFTELNANKIGQLTTAGVFTEFPIPTANSGPNGIALGPDGNLWFTEINANKIGRITTAGVITEFALPTASSQPADIVTGPDGNLWITEFAANQIARMTPAGAAVEFVIPTASSHPQSIVPGPDGNLWFTEGLTGKIARITTAGTITEFPLPSPTSFPEGMAAGPDGNLWFVEFSGNQVGRITTSGTITEFPIPTAGSNPDSIVNGPDGNLWFTERAGNNIGQITTAGVFAEFPIPTAGSGTVGIATGPDANMWFTERTANQIGQLVTGTLIVTNTNDSGPGSLRAAITLANQAGAPLIRFAIPGGGVHTISPLTPLPFVFFPVTIDGYTQPGASPNTLASGTNAVVLIEIDGSGAGRSEGLVVENNSVTFLSSKAARSAHGKSARRTLETQGKRPARVTASSPVIRGLAINNFDGDAIEVFFDGTKVEGCFLGTDPSGLSGKGNNGEGVYLGAITTVGGSSPAQRNLISGNFGDGIQLSGDGSTIQGNLIGTDATGTADLGNEDDGIYDPFESSFNTIGGLAVGAGNVIAFNGGQGVDIACQDGCGTSNTISGNSIFSNNSGISLDGTSTPIANDHCDADTGGNNQQNYPVVTAANTGATATFVQGTLDSTANAMFRVEFFATPACDRSGNGQGKTFLGSTTIGTDDSCGGAFSVLLPTGASSGDAITATATDMSTGDTSEFSACLPATAGIGDSTTVLVSGPNPSTFGQTVTMTATVTPINGPTPTGTVTIFDGAAPIGTVPLNGAGVATFSTASLAVGPHTLMAVYNGDTFFAGSNSSPVIQVVNRANTLTVVMSSANPSSGPVTFTAIVSPFAPAAGVPTGTVTFMDGAATLGSAPLAGGQASFTTSSLTTGTHSITGVYSGDSTYNPSTSSPLSQQVNNNCQKPQPVSDLTINPSSAAPGDVYVLRWTDVLLGQPGQYDVLLSTDNGASFHTLGLTNTNSFAGSPTQAAGSVLMFTVRAEPLCSVGTAKFSDPGNVVSLTVTGTCAKPAAPTVTIDKGSVAPGESYTLSWNATLTGAGQYRILQSIGAGTFQSIGVTTTTTFVGQAPDEPPGTSISILVRAEPACASSPSGFGTPASPIVFVVSAGCSPPGAPSDVILQGVDTTGPPTPTDFLGVSWSAPATGSVTRYGVRINGDPETSTTSTSATLLPRGENLDPITAFVRAFNCSPEESGPTVQSATIALLVSPPIANFSASPSPQVGSAITFTDTSSPQATSWLWIFDDGGTDTHQSPSHAFTTAGAHTVFLIASNGAGSSTKSLVISVASASVASLGRAVLMTSAPFDSSNAERRRAHVQLAGEGAVWLRVQSYEASDSLLFLRFLDGAGHLVRERSLTVAAGAVAVYDVGAYGLTGGWTLEIVGAQKFDAAVVEVRRPSPKEVRR